MAAGRLAATTDWAGRPWQSTLRPLLLRFRREKPPSNYPEPFVSRMLGRTKRPLGDFFGIKNVRPFARLSRAARTFALPNVGVWG